MSGVWHWSCDFQVSGTTWTWFEPEPLYTGLGAWLMQATCSLQLGRAEVLRSLRNFPCKHKTECCSTNCLNKRGREKGSSQRSTIQGLGQSVFSQTNTGTVSRPTLGRVLTSGAKCIRAFLSTTKPAWAETGNDVRSFSLYTVHDGFELLSWETLKSFANTKSRVSNQNGVSLLYIMLEIHRCGQEPSKYTRVASRQSKQEIT